MRSQKTQIPKKWIYVLVVNIIRFPNTSGKEKKNRSLQKLTGFSCFFLVYCTEESQPYVLPAVKKTEAKLIASPQNNHEYIPSFGEPRFTKACVEFLLGNDSPAILEDRAHGIQTISGSGALYMGAQFLCQVLNFKRIYLSNPSWGKMLL